ncbi:hypothetical protein DL763_010591 [Monosporascus cannonballus]|nr:hypothetical protein DL763_010591 [Monosporascus cannonballus]
MPLFRYRFASAATAKYMLCTKRVVPAEGVQGDSLDLDTFLHWVDFYFDVNRDDDDKTILDDDGDETYTYLNGFCRELCRAIFRLYTAFEAAEKTYRITFGITGVKKN